MIPSEHGIIIPSSLSSLRSVLRKSAKEYCRARYQVYAAIPRYYGTIARYCRARYHMCVFNSELGITVHLCGTQVKCLKSQLAIKSTMSLVSIT